MPSRKMFPVCLLLIAIAGCGQTQVSAPNREYVEKLQTAISAQNSEWLAAATAQIAEQHAKSAMTDAEFTVLDAIAAKARAGDWKGAQQDVFALSEGQHATDADVETTRKFKRRAPRKPAAPKQGAQRSLPPVPVVSRGVSPR